MTELIKQGLEISALGMGLTFAALGLLILAMFVLEKLFRVQDEVKPPEAEEAPAANQAEIIAAIAAALHHFQEEDGRSPNLGANLEQGRSAWWRANAARQSPTQKPHRRQT